MHNHAGVNGAGGGSSGLERARTAVCTIKRGLWVLTGVERTRRGLGIQGLRVRTPGAVRFPCPLAALLIAVFDAVL